MPAVAENMMARLGLSSENFPLLDGFSVKHEIENLKSGHKFEVGDTLFERISPERLEELKQKYGGGK